MDGVFINLTNEDVSLIIDNQTIVIPANPDLITPIKHIIKTTLPLSGIVSSPLASNDIHYLQNAGWYNSTYNKINRTEQNILINISMVSSYVKYPFTNEQIDKINYIANGRLRLLILTKDDAEYWSSGKFESNPFRNYRLFTNTLDGLVEYPIPKTYLDAVYNSVKNLIQ
jgi:hypothetical protein